MNLRDYQKELVDSVFSHENHALNLLIQADTGSGKTIVLAEIAKKYKNVICIAHRNILIKQLSAVLAQFKIKHNILATKHTQRQCILEHRKQSNNMFSMSSSKHVCSIDSLLSRYKRNRLELDTTKKWLIIVDEAHHMIEKNKWGKLLDLFPNSRIVGATAPPCRLDQKSLSRKKDGVFDKLIQAEELKENSLSKLIDKGFVSQFKCYSLESHVEVANLKKNKGEYTYKSLCEQTSKVIYKMAGDAVKYYKKYANHKQALVFCVNIEIAKNTAEYFRKNGISAAAIHSKLSAVETTRIFELFKHKQIKVLCNVDMISEGVNVPAIEALIMLRKTASLGLYRQWIGRSLRPENGKKYAILLDHVANIREHGLPDKNIEWSLVNPPVFEKSNLFPCPFCRFLNSYFATECEECGEILKHKDRQANQEDIEYVDFELVEIHRRKADQEKIKQQQKWQYENVINDKSLKKMEDGSFIGKLVTKLRIIVVENLQTELSIAKCNEFLEKTQNRDFWISNFSNKDIKNNNIEKSLRVYKKWLKSN